MLNENMEASKSLFQVFLLVSLFSCSLNVSGQDTPLDTKRSAKNPIEKVLPKLLDLGAKKCIPCKKMAPILVELEREYQGLFDVEFVDVWQSENRERALKHKVSTIPTQIFFDANGVELWRHVGFISKADLLKKWKDLGYEFKPNPKSSKSDGNGAS